MTQSSFSATLCLLLGGFLELKSGNLNINWTIETSRPGHVGLLFPYDWDSDEVERELVAFYDRGLGLRVEQDVIELNGDGTAKDRGGAGLRFYIYAGWQTLLLVYTRTASMTAQRLIDDFYGRSGFHICLPMNPVYLTRIMELSQFERATEWHQTKRSVFLRGPWNLEVELQHQRTQEEVE